MFFLSRINAEQYTDDDTLGFASEEIVKTKEFNERLGLKTFECGNKYNDQMLFRQSLKKIVMGTCVL